MAGASTISVGQFEDTPPAPSHGRSGYLQPVSAVKAMKSPKVTSEVLYNSLGFAWHQEKKQGANREFQAEVVFSCAVFFVILLWKGLSFSKSFGW